MRHMGNSGKIAIGAVLAALALLVLTGITLRERRAGRVPGALAAAYGPAWPRWCPAPAQTLAASGVGSILFIAFGIAFLGSGAWPYGGTGRTCARR